MTSTLLQQVRVIDSVSQTDRIADVLITEGNIAHLSSQILDLPNDTQIRDCRGLVLGTGLVDLYSCSGEPGFEERETLSSFMQAASAGGFTRVSLLPNTSPPIDNPGVVAQLQRGGAGRVRQTSEGHLFGGGTKDFSMSPNPCSCVSLSPP